MKTKNQPLAVYLDNEAQRFQQLAKETAFTAIHKAGYSAAAIDARDERVIRDHEIRAETFKAAAKIAAGHHA